MRFVRASTLLLVLVNLSCTKAPQWTSDQWQGKGSKPLPSTFSKSISKTTLKNHQIEIKQQTVGGVPVDGSFAKIVVPTSVRVNKSEARPTWVRVRYVEGQDLPSPKYVQAALLKKTVALAKAAKHLPKGICQPELSMTKAEPLVKWVKQSWRLVFVGECQDQSGQLYQIIISELGKVLEYSTQGSSFIESKNAAEVNASLYSLGPKTSVLKQLTLIISERPNFLSNPLLEVVSDSGEKIPTLQQIPTIKPEDSKFDLLQVYFYASSAISWMADRLSYQPQSLKVRTDVGFPEKTNAAFYFQREIRLGSGDDQIFSNLSLDRSIVTHEVMHSFVDTLARLPFKGEGGSLNEGLCDALTALYLDNPRMGENAYLKAAFQRTLENDMNFNHKTGKLYSDSLILSGTIWKIRQSVSQAYALDLTAYLLTYLVPSSDFNESQQLIQTWLNELKPSEKKNQIALILNERGWISPQ